MANNNNITNDWRQSNNTMSLLPLKEMKADKEESPVSGGTGHLLPKERELSTFDIEKLIYFLDGGKKCTLRRRFIGSPVEDVDASDIFYMSRPELLRYHIKNLIDTHKKFLPKFVPTREDYGYMSHYSIIGGSLGNHLGLFLSTVKGMASDEQIEWWLHKARTLQIIGNYAQTELGHGSNVRGLQTTATFDKETQEFVLNTPNLRSIKWWPGALGKVATHAAVYAQLIIDGKEYGVHVFMLQIRDENHRPLPGIEVGDLGPKLGDGANDTGFLRIDNVRIPREHMFAKYQHVTPEGKYVKSAKKTNDKLHYATMMYTRGFMVRGAGSALAKAVTIATRYSCVRVQGFKKLARGVSYKTPENKIIDYQIQRYRIFKQMSLAYVIRFAGLYIVDRFQSLEGEKHGVIVNTSELPEIAATSSGLKAMCTFIASQGIEDCRKCCGGNGYLLSSGIGKRSVDYVWQITAEGDFIILMLQTARFLLKTLNAAKQGKKLSPICDYLTPIKDPNFVLKSSKPELKTVEDFLDVEKLYLLFQYRALANVSNIGVKFMNAMAKYDNDFATAFNSIALELIDAVNAHCHCFLLKSFYENIQKSIQSNQDPEITEALTNLCRMYANSNLLDDKWQGLLSNTQNKVINEAVVITLERLRPDAISLTDAFDYPDNVLNSSIGCYDGNVYERLFEAAKKSDLNRVDPFLGYEELVKPGLDTDFLKLRNKPVSKL